jgi:hypothetical protein
MSKSLVIALRGFVSQLARAGGPAFERGDELLVCEPPNLVRLQ